MKRRNFLKIGSSLASTGILMNGLPMRTFATPSLLAASTCEAMDRVLVIVYLNGANDFINTFVPLNQFSTYVGHRPNIYLQESKLITLDSTLGDSQQLGLHPSLTAFKELYDCGRLNIVQGVGMPNPNRSHFKAKDLWFRGSDGTEPNIDTGWIGRFLDNRYPLYEGIPFTGEPDPLGIILGKIVDTGFHAPHEHNFEINLSGQDPSGFYSLISSIGGPPIPNIPNTEHGDLLNYIMNIENNVNVYSQRITSTFDAGSNSATYPDNDLADQLRTVARMLSGGSRTKVFLTQQGGYDTHAAQVVAGATETGRHATLLADMSSAIKAFQNDLQALGLNDKVLTVVFSEFGRKIVQNGNFGLDHGTLGSMITIGTGVQPGIIGQNLDLNALDGQNAPDFTTMQYDYRQVFGTVIQDWMGADSSSVQATFFDTSYVDTPLPLVQSAQRIGPDCISGAIDFPVDIKVFLQGCYDPNTGRMHDNLRTAGNFPEIEPYTALGHSVENGSAEVGQGVLDIAHAEHSMVDWVLVELRKADEDTLVRKAMAALVRRDGKVVACEDGVSPIVFRNVSVNENYKIAIRHRNHLGVMSSTISCAD